MNNQVETSVEVSLTERDRFSVALRLILILPALLFIASFAEFTAIAKGVSLGGFFFFPALLALVFTGKYPSYVYEFHKAFFSLNLRANVYFFLLTDEYPTIENNPSFQVKLPEIEGGSKLNRGMPLIKWFIAIPLYVVGLIYLAVSILLTIYAWIFILITGKYPEPVANFVVGTLAFWNRVHGYSLLLVTDEYPTFSNSL